jgi:hypothetical protein
MYKRILINYYYFDKLSSIHGYLYRSSYCVHLIQFQISTVDGTLVFKPRYSVLLFCPRWSRYPGEVPWCTCLDVTLGEAARQQRTCSPLATPRQQLFGTCFQCSPSCWLAGHCSEHLRKSTIKYAIALISRKKMKNPSFTAYATNH